MHVKMVRVYVKQSMDFTLYYPHATIRLECLGHEFTVGYETTRDTSVLQFLLCITVWILQNNTLCHIVIKLDFLAHMFGMGVVTISLFVIVLLPSLAEVLNVPLSLCVN